jgi:hypothetical protein
LHEAVQLAPVVQVQKARLAAHGVLLVELHHQQPVGGFGHEGAVGVHGEQTVSLAQIGVAGVGVLDQETCVVLVGHGVVVGRAQDVADGGAELHVVVAILAHAFQTQHKAAMPAVLDDVHQGLAKVGTHVGLQAARQVKAHERHVLEVLHVDIAHIGQEGVQGFGVQRQLQQAGCSG